MNVRNIRKIKQNLQTLQKNLNNLQKSQISKLTHYLNLTMIQVWKHCGVLQELDAKQLVFNNTLKRLWKLQIIYIIWQSFSLISVQK